VSFEFKFLSLSRSFRRELGYACYLKVDPQSHLHFIIVQLKIKILIENQGSSSNSTSLIGTLRVYVVGACQKKLNYFVAMNLDK